MGTVTRQLESASPEQTRALGVALGRLLQPGDFVGLMGELGAGKTEFSRGVAEGAGVARGEVASPTFAIVYPYQGRIPLFHADLYRLADEEELYATGFFDLLTEGTGAFLVEWIDRIPAAMPDDALDLRIQTVSIDQRRIVVTAHGERSTRLLDAWQEALGADREM